MHLIAPLVLVLAALTGCVQPTFQYQPTPTVSKRLPIRAVVWLFNDATPDTPESQTTVDGSPVFQTNLTRARSSWLPELGMTELSQAFASELQAQVAENAEMVAPVGHTLPIVEEEQGGTKLMVSGTVEEACWVRSPSGGGSYRFRFSFSATVVREKAANLTDYWTKTVSVEQPRRGKPAQDIAKAVHEAFGEAAEELARALTKGEAAMALPQPPQ